MLRSACACQDGRFFRRQRHVHRQAADILRRPRNRAGRSDSTHTGAISYDNFDENLGLLAKTDFTRSLELAKSIKLKETSIGAKVAVCRGVLLEN